METVHIYPLEDVMEHLVDGQGPCWCRPTYDVNGLGDRVCIHNKFDAEYEPNTGDKVH